MSRLLKQIAQHNAPGPRASVPRIDRSINVVLGGQPAAPSLGRPRRDLFESSDDEAAMPNEPPAASYARAVPPRQSLYGETYQAEPEDRRFEPLDPSELPVVGSASEEALTLYDAAAADEPTNRPPRRAAAARARRYPGEISSDGEEEEDADDRSGGDLSERKFVGVTTAHGHSRARIKHDGSEHDLGTFDMPEEGARAYDAKAREFGRPVNFPRAGEKQAIRARARAPRKRARTTPAVRAAPPVRANPLERPDEQLMFERDAARAERDSLLIALRDMRTERDSLRGQLLATTGFKDQLLAELLKRGVDRSGGGAQ